MKLKTASSIVIASSVMSALILRIHFHLAQSDATKGLLQIVIGGVSIRWLALISWLLLLGSLLMFYIFLYRSGRIRKLGRLCGQILGTMICFHLLFMVFIGTTDLWPRESYGFKIGNLSILPLVVVFLRITLDIPLALLFLTFILSGSWNRCLRVMAGIMVALCSLRVMLSVAFYILHLQCVYVLMLEMERNIFDPCYIIFFVLLTYSIQSSDALEMRGETSEGYVLHSKMRHILFSFQGRVSRATYWLLAYPLIFVMFYFIEAINFNYFLHYHSEWHMKIKEWMLLVSELLFAIVLLWPALAVTTKRMHDRNYSALKWMLISLIPIANVWILIQAWFLKGDEGSNDYGADPLQCSLEDS